MKSTSLSYNTFDFIYLHKSLCLPSLNISLFSLQSTHRLNYISDHNTHFSGLRSTRIMFDDGEEERGKSSSCNQLFRNDVGYAPAKPGQPDPNLVCKNWLQSPFDKNIVEETCVNKRLFGSTSQTCEISSEWYDNYAINDVAKWDGVSFREMLALANPTGKKDFDYSGGDQTQQSRGKNLLCDLNWPPRTVEEPSLGLSLHITPLTPDKRMNFVGDDDVATLVEGDQECEKGLAEQTKLDETPQQKQRRRKHRPKVVTEGKPKRVRKRATPKNLDGSSPGKRKYVRREGVETSPATPSVDEASGTIYKSPDQEIKKRCKRKIDFDELENQARVMVDETSRRSSEVMENYQKVQETESLSPITPSKTELPYGRVERNYTKAKCKINFLQETHDKVQIHVPSPNESSCSTSVYNNGNEARRLKGGFSGDINAVKLLHERNVGMYYDSLESYLSRYTDYSSVCQQYTQSSAINSKTGKAPAGRIDMWSNDRYMQTSGQNFKRSKLMVYDSVLFDGRIHSGYQPQHTYMQSHAADFHVGTPNKYSMVTSLYHDRLAYNQNLRCQFIYDLNALINQFERLHISKGYHEKNALVVYQQDRSIVPFVKKQKHRPKVDLDDETNRVWMLLLEDINSEGIDGTDEDKAKWWEEERRVFRGRADSFIARMHLVQGDRRFSRWKGSVLDSVVGVYLTQNVSDHLSSSAFMSLAARYPLNTSSEPLHESENHDPIPMMLQEADSCQEKEAVNSDEFSKNCIISDNSECEVAELSEKDSSVYNISVINHIKIDETASSHSSADAYTMHKSEEQKDVCKATVGGYTSFVELSHMQEATRLHERKDIQKNSEKCASEESGISVEFASKTTIETVNTISYQSQTTIETVNTISSQRKTTTETVNTISSQESGNSNCIPQQVFETTNFSTETSKVRENNNIEFTSRETVQKVVDFHLNKNGSNRINNGVVDVSSKIGKEKVGNKETEVEWDNIRLEAEAKRKRERTPFTMDSMDYEAIRAADVNDVADAIKERGMNNRLAERIKGMLDRLVKDHGSIDLEWLRDVPPDKAKEYLLSFRGLGLKSVECIRLLTLHHLAFPVDTNVGRIAVRLGWVPLQALPESLQLHLLELYPIQESIQKYLWPRLCKLDQKTLYELHYQMITFGKVFCTKTKPNCNACPLRAECRHFASAFASARLALPAPEERTANSTENRTVQNPIGMIDLPSATEQTKQLSEVQNCNFVIKEPTTSGTIVEEPTTTGPIVEVPATPGPIVEMPASPEPEQIQQEICDIEDFSGNTEEIPMIKLNIEEFTQNLQTYMEKHMELGEGDMSKALVALTSEAASIPAPKLKNINQLRTEHQVYELPESHPLLEGLDRLEPDDPCSYLLAIWTPGETADSIQPPEGQCCSQESGTLCNEETCFFCNSTRETNSQTVRGTLLIPCRTAMRGSFPLNGTYFQVNEVFADHESSLNPIDVPRAWLWNLPRRTVYFGSSIPTIFKGLTTEEIQLCFWRGFVCVRGFDRKKRAPRPLRARLHIPASRLKSQPKTPETEKLML
ncbi:hypothetical protein QVD17_20367 [Tagetes erecta]|uniref:HhH-GPD domain-containing protein n=1 Tax=Tagetes erecta TaxID=13708 RepID=A0AAD8KL43_TARER|nr:hypothetical protein QVD17_20367 [Tagetes erecta]